MARVGRARVLPLLALAALPGCRRPQDLPPLTRLLPALGPAVALTLDQVTRPATLLAPGESRACAIEAGPGTRLRLWMGLPEVPPRGFVVVRARVEGRTILERRAAAGRLSSWMELVADVPPDARRLEIEVDLVTAGGRSLGPEGGSARIALASPRLARPARRPPRVLVWISQDTVRADHLSAYGYARPTSPALERLARESLVFEDAMATASWTLPSLASQVTSLLPYEHGAVRSDLALRPGVETVFEVLSRSGFTVLGASANPFFSASHWLANGFDSLVVNPTASASRLRSQLTALLAEWDGGDLALFVHFMDPHLPYQPPEPYDTMFQSPAPAGPVPALKDRQLRARTDLYDGELAFTDAQIGALLSILERRGLLKGAVLVYTADHGDELLDHGGFDHGHSLYQELLHVPLVMRVPGRKAQRIATPVSMLDVAPTVLDAFDLKAPPAFRGESLLPLARGAARKGRQLFAETQTRKSRPLLYAVREGTRKCIVGLSRKEQGKMVSTEVFELATDPGERTSLEGEGDPRRRLAERYAASAAAATLNARKAVVGKEALEQLRALGYLE